MGQFNDRVTKARMRLEAEEWAKGIKSIHLHRLSSMWYDNRPQDTEQGYVTDTQFNDGHIKRELQDGSVVILGKRLTGEELIWEYHRNT